MEIPIKELSHWLTAERLAVALRVGFLLLIALPVLLAASNGATRLVGKHFNAQRGMVVGKLLRYAGVILIALLVFNQLGFSLAPLLGAAGIIGLALAFASQTSVSNVISGLFLIAERPFEVGDVIAVGGVTGVVLSIDTLSVKLRTFDNRYVRLPNETLIKSEIVNNTRFPVRRVDLNIGVSYREDLPRVRELLTEIARDNPLCLMEPAPAIVINGFGDSSIDFLFGVWVAKENYLDLKNSIQEDLKRRFGEAGIEIPYPQLTVHTVSVPDRTGLGR